MPHPVLHPATQMTQLSGDRLQLRGVDIHVTLRDRNGALREVLASCDGTRSREAIVAIAAREFAKDEIHGLLDVLVAQNFVVEEDISFGLEPLVHYTDVIRRRLSPLDEDIPTAVGGPKTVGLFGTGIVAESVAKRVATIGWNVVRQPDDMADLGLLLAVSDNYDHRFFRGINCRAVERGRPLLIGGMDQNRIHLGPFVLPGATACFECFYHRSRA